MEAIFTPIALPFGRLLMFLFDLVGNYALSLTLIAVIVRVILIPVQMKAKRGQLRQSRLAPKMEEIRKKHGANKQKLQEETARLYREEGVNPLAGCLWGFIQMPIMIALFYAIRQPLTLMMGVAREYFAPDGIIITTLQDNLIDMARYAPDVLDASLADFYAEVYLTQNISQHWNLFEHLGIPNLQNISFNLGQLNLAEIPNWQFFWSETTDWSLPASWLPGLLLFFIPVMSGGIQFVSAALMRKMNPAAPESGANAGSMGTVLKLMPLMSVFFGFILPAALSFYWMIGGVLQILQDVWLTRKYTKILDAEDAVKEKERKEKEAALEAKRLESERRKAEGLALENKNISKKKRQRTEKQEQLEKAAQWEKKTTPQKKKEVKDEPSRVDNRRFARGRAYIKDRYDSVNAPDESEYYEDENNDSDFAASTDKISDSTIIDVDYTDADEYDVEYDEADDDDEYGEPDDDFEYDESDDDFDQSDDSNDSDGNNEEKFETKRFD